MDYTQGNKDAWEEAFDNRSENWCSDILMRYRSEDFPFIEGVLTEEISKLDLTDKVIGQFCCNNGRELLSIMKFGAKQGIGFDIAENQISYANEIAKELQVNCEFIAGDILEIDKRYDDTFDFLIITIGTLCWFQDLNLFFERVSRCLKTNGSVMIHESHPVTNMLGAPGEEEFDEDNPRRIIYSYFERIWKENDGMEYIAGKAYKSKTFTSFSHPFSSILDGIASNGLCLRAIHEYDFDTAAGMFSKLNQTGIPLSYILRADKMQIRRVKRPDSEVNLTSRRGQAAGKLKTRQKRL